MSAYRELADRLPYDPTERSGVLGARRAEGTWTIRASVGCGGLAGLLVLTGGGIAPPGDWGAALFFGLLVTIATRAVGLASARLRGGGWRAWRARRVNGEACDVLSGGLGIALALVLASGAGGIGPAFSPLAAVLTGLVAMIAARAVFTVARWP